MISQIVVFPFGMMVKPRNIKRQSFVCSVGSIYSVSIFLRSQLKITHCMVNLTLYLAYRKISTENVV